MPRIAVVTGANRGLGYAITQTLCRHHPSWIVYVTSRDVRRGEDAVNKMQKEDDITPRFYQLDINDHESILRLRDHIVAEHGGLDILVNNAGIAYKKSSTASFSEQAQNTLQTNYFSTMNVCDILFPILRPKARVIHITSRVAIMALGDCSRSLMKQFQNPSDMDHLNTLMKEFMELASNNEQEKNGWPSDVYGVSKLGLIVATILQQRMFDKDSRSDLIVNCCCPGYVATDMTSNKGYLSPLEGAVTPVYLAELPSKYSKNPKGLFLAENRPISWTPNT